MSRGRPKGAGAVMADRARGEVAADDAQAALYRRLEFFPTPPWAARAGGELIKLIDPGPWTCWEPAAGQGHMAAGLAAYFSGVVATDIHAHRGAVRLDGVRDFLDPATDWPGVDWIVTNPPFAAAADFVRLGLQRARRGVAILARATFLESAGRYPLFFGEQRLTVYAPFFERVPMHLGRWEPGGSSATAYAWFVWLRPEAFGPEARVGPVTRWGFPRVIPVPPGTRDRLTMPDDAGRFGVQTTSPLLDGGAQ